jgi:hypothetical protein
MILTEYAAALLNSGFKKKEGYELVAKAIQMDTRIADSLWESGMWYFRDGEYEKALDDAKNLTKYSDPRHAPVGGVF